MYWIFHIVGMSEDAQIPHVFNSISFLLVLPFGGICVGFSLAGYRFCGLGTLKDAILPHVFNSVLLLIGQ